MLKFKCQTLIWPMRILLSKIIKITISFYGTSSYEALLNIFVHSLFLWGRFILKCAEKIIFFHIFSLCNTDGGVVWDQFIYVKIL